MAKKPKEEPQDPEGFDMEKPSGQAPNAWPGDLDTGSRIVATVTGVDPTGGRQALGILDLESTTGEVFRFYLNKPGKGVVDRAMEKQRVRSLAELKGRRVAIVFAGWAGPPGRKYRTFEFGIGK